MHTIEPYYQWKYLYTAEEDVQSPFFGREYSEFEFSNAIFDHYIHPQWDEIGSPTLYLKILYIDYTDGFAILELMGEWNDCIQNDIMTLKRDIIDVLIDHGIKKYILIGENVLNFHASDDCYYEEWFDDISDDGWIMMLNFRQHVLDEFTEHHLDQYLLYGGAFNEIDWRIYNPNQLFQRLESSMVKKLNF